MKFRLNLTLFACLCIPIHPLLFNPQIVMAQELVQTNNGGFYRELPKQSNQDDTWTCGANSASRVLKYFGHNVSYPDVRGVAQNDHGIIPTEVCVGGGKVCLPFTDVCTEKPKKCFNTGEFKTGLEPDEVRQVLARWEGGNAKLSTRASFEELKARIQEGKPVLTLLRVGSFKPAGGIFGTWPEMHWVTVHGFNETTQDIYYTDTQDNSVVRQQSYSEFQGQWDWSIGDGLANETIWGKGVRPKTMVWVDRTLIRPSSRASGEYYTKRIGEHCQWLLGQKNRGDWWNSIQSSAQRDTGNTDSEQYRTRVADHCEWFLNNQGRIDWWNMIEASARRDAGL
jgi:hypothetical protein